MGGGGGVNISCSFCLTLIYRRILGFFPSFIIGVSSSKFSDTYWLKISKSVPGLCRSSPWRRCRTGHFLWVIQARAVKRSLVGPSYLLLLEMPGCRHPEDESFRRFLSGVSYGRGSWVVGTKSWLVGRGYQVVGRY